MQTTIDKTTFSRTTPQGHGMTYDLTNGTVENVIVVHSITGQVYRPGPQVAMNLQDAHQAMNISNAAMREARGIEAYLEGMSPLARQTGGQPHEIKRIGAEKLANDLANRANHHFYTAERGSDNFVNSIEKAVGNTRFAITNTSTHEDTKALADAVRKSEFFNGFRR